MNISDLKSEAGIRELNNYLEHRTYISDYVPTQDDITVFKKITKPPGLNTPHALRWYNHIKSFSNEEIKEFPAGTGCSGDASLSKPNSNAKADDDDIDLFASDEEEDKEAEKLREERLKSYQEKKSKKPAVIAKSSILLDIKPWDDETDMKQLEANARTIEMDGLVWGASKLVPLAFGIKKLQIMCVIEDDKVSVDDLVERIEAFQDHVQSVDIAAFNKI